MSEFQQFKQLLNNTKRRVSIKSEEYKEFKRQYVMNEGLKGRSLGEAFCRHFGVVDYHTIGMNNEDADKYIRKTYVGKTKMIYEYVTDEILYDRIGFRKP